MSLPKATTELASLESTRHCLDPPYSFSSHGPVPKSAEQTILLDAAAKENQNHSSAQAIQRAFGR